MRKVIKIFFVIPPIIEYLWGIDLAGIFKFSIWTFDCFESTMSWKFCCVSLLRLSLGQILLKGGVFSPFSPHLNFCYILPKILNWVMGRVRWDANLCKELK